MLNLLSVQLSTPPLKTWGFHGPQYTKTTCKLLLEEPLKLKTCPNFRKRAQFNLKPPKPSVTSQASRKVHAPSRIRGTGGRSSDDRLKVSSYPTDQKMKSPMTLRRGNRSPLKAYSLIMPRHTHTIPMSIPSPTFYIFDSAVRSNAGTGPHQRFVDVLAIKGLEGWTSILVPVTLCP